MSQDEWYMTCMMPVGPPTSTSVIGWVLGLGFRVWVF